MCLCRKKASKKDSSEFEGYVFCDAELSADEQDKMFELFKKHFVQGTVGKDEFLNGAFEITGRKIQTDSESSFGTNDPLSFLFFFTMKKCHFEINWNHVVSYLSKLGSDLSEFFKEPKELFVDLCFSDKHLLHVRKTYSCDASLLIRAHENDRFVTSFLNFLQELKKNPEMCDKIICGKSVNSWINEMKSIGKRIFNERKACNLSNSSYLSRVREKKVKNINDEIIPIVSVNNCGTCGIPLVNLPVSEHMANLKFFANTVTVFDDEDDLQMSRAEWDVIDELERLSKKPKLD